MSTPSKVGRGDWNGDRRVTSSSGPTPFAGASAPPSAAAAAIVEAAPTLRAPPAAGVAELRSLIERYTLAAHTCLGPAETELVGQAAALALEVVRTGGGCA